jgi:hypothetical protein
VPTYVDWLAVGFLGGLIGTAELVGRYRDAPAGAIYNTPAFFYVGLNIVASLLALAFARAFNWTLTLPDTTGAEAARWTQVMLAGLGAMAFFRTSLFVVRVGDKDVGVGPSSFLQVFLAAADRSVDRLRAAVRAGAISKIMAGLDCDRTFEALPPYCLALMQNVPDDVQTELRRAVDELRSETSIEPPLRLRLLGLELVNVVGVDVLQTAVVSLGTEIKPKPAP